MGIMLFACGREFEQNASGLLTELYEIDQEKSHKLLSLQLPIRNKSSVLALADDARLMDFMNHDCCQTRINRMWHGKLAIGTLMWQVRLKVSRHFKWTLNKLIG